MAETQAIDPEFLQAEQARKAEESTKIASPTGIDPEFLQAQEEFKKTEPSPSASPSSPPGDFLSYFQPSAHTLGYFGQQAAQGVLSTAALPRTAADFVNWGLQKSGLRAKDSPLPSDLEVLPGQEKVDQWSHDLGIDTIKPTGTTEQLIGAAGRGLGGTLPFMAGGAALAPIKMAGAVADITSGLSAGLGGEIGHMISPDSVWAPVLGAIVGGLGGGKGASFLSDAANKQANAAKLSELNKQLAAAQETASATKAAQNDLKSPHFEAKVADDAQFESLSQEQKAAAKATIDSSNVLRDSVISGAKEHISGSNDWLKSELEQIDTGKQVAQGALENITEGNKAQAGDSLRQLGNNRNATPDPDSTGARIQSTARTFRSESIPATELRVWDPVNSVMSGQKTPLDNFIARAHFLSSKFGNLQPLFDRLAPNIGARLKSATKYLREPAELSERDQVIADAMGLPADPIPPPIPTWEESKNFRSWLGDQLENPQSEMFKTLNEANLRSLYQAISEDLREATTVHGVEAQFAEANRVSSQIRSFAEGPLKEIIHGPEKSWNDPRTGKVVANLLNEGKTTGETLSALRAQPGTSPLVDILAGHVLHRLESEPELWTKLTPGAKVALVPDQAERAEIERALATRAQDAPKISDAPFIAQRQSAQATHEANVTTMQKLISDANRAHQNMVESTQASRDAAILAAKRANRNSSVERARARIAAETKAEEIRRSVEDIRNKIEGIKSTTAGKTEKSILHGVRTLLWSHLGEPVSAVATHAMGLVDPTGTLSFANKFIPAAIPMVAHGLSHLVTHGGKIVPSAAKAAAIGTETQGIPPLENAHKGTDGKWYLDHKPSGKRYLIQGGENGR